MYCLLIVIILLDDDILSKLDSNTRLLSSLQFSTFTLHADVPIPMPSCIAGEKVARLTKLMSGVGPRLYVWAYLYTPTYTIDPVGVGGSEQRFRGGLLSLCHFQHIYYIYIYIYAVRFDFQKLKKRWRPRLLLGLLQPF